MRPTTRPAQPYTVEEILDGVEQHFVKEGNPRCVNQNGDCVYGQTGCAVGCLLTEEDAKILDSHGTMGIRGFLNNEPIVYQSYFLVEHLVLLQTLQNIHDSVSRNSDTGKFLGDYIREHRIQTQNANRSG